MRIGDLAGQTGLTVETIRYYEKLGLLPPATRLTNNYRDYQTRHIERLDFIRHCRNLDIGLQEIRELLTNIDAHDPSKAARVHLLIERHLNEVDRRIADLKELRGHLTDIAARCQGHHDAQHPCGLVQELVSPVHCMCMAQDRKSRTND